MIRIELVIAVLLSAFIILNGYFQTNLTNAYIYKLVARFFGYSPLMGPFIAVFAAYLWGTDYEYGTLRNKLICGRSLFFQSSPDHMCWTEYCTNLVDS